MKTKDAVLRALRHGRMGREAVAELTGIAMGRTSDLLGDLGAEKLIQKVGHGNSTEWELTDAGKLKLKELR